MVWKKVRLGDISKISSGNTPLRSEKKFYENGTIPWVKTMDLNNGNILATNEKITPLAAEKCKPYPAGTLLVAMYGGFNQIGRTGLLTFPASVNQALAALLLDENVAYANFVQYYLNANVEKWRTFAASSRKDPNITSHDVENFQIILPPLAEQKKIAETLSVWDSAIDKMEKLIKFKEANKKRLISTLIDFAAESKKNITNTIKIDGVIIDKSKWRKCKLSEIASGFEYGMNAAAKEYDGKNKYIRITDIDENTHRFNAETLVSPNGLLDKKYLVNSGDILFARTGASTGKSYWYNENDGLLYYAGFLIRVNIESENSHFIYLQTLTSDYQNWVKKCLQGPDNQE